MKAGDVLLLTGGRMLQLLDDESDNSRIFKDYAWVQFLDRNESSHLDIKNANIENNLGQSAAVLAAFYSARGIHLRLNQFSKV